MGAAQWSKHVISISLGSPSRDARAIMELGNTRVLAERRGTGGDLREARRLLEAWDGKVDALGLGGTDLYLYAGGRRYTLRQTQRLIANVRHTPVVDGSGLKNSLERRLTSQMAADVPLRGARVLLMCGVDRFGMAEAFLAAGAEVTFGDLIFGLNINKPIRSLKALSRWAALLAPVITRLPVSWFYPVGQEQEKRTPRHTEYFLANDIIAGDFHFIRKFMPEKLPGKTIVTNTVTAGDRELLRQAGAEMLYTTTPCLEGRSFGTNVLEAALVALQGSGRALAPEDYNGLLERCHITSSAICLREKER